MKTFDLKAMDDVCRLQEAAHIRIANLEANGATWSLRSPARTA